MGEHRFGDGGLFSLAISLYTIHWIGQCNSICKSMPTAMGTWSRDLEGYPAVHWFLSQMPNRSNVQRGTGSYALTSSSLTILTTHCVYLENIARLGDCCFNTDIWFAETHCFVWALACSCQQKPEPDGQPAKPFISLQNCYVLQKMAKVHSVHCNAFCFASLQSLSFHLRTDKHWLNWTVHCFVCWFARLVMICKVLISLLNNSPQDGAAVFFCIKPNKMSNVAVDHLTLFNSWNLRQKF